MPITRRFTVYTNAGVSVPPVIHVNQYDRGETWIFTLLEPDGSKYSPASGGIVGIKADGHAIINTATVNGNGEVVVSETQQMTAAAGKAVYEIIFDNSTHGTANFIVCVEPKPGDNATLSDSDLSLIQEAIDSTIPANIEASVQDWMDDNLAPAEWVIDNTLSIAGAAADAKKVGDVTSELKTAVKKIDSRFDNPNVMDYFSLKYETRYVESTTGQIRPEYNGSRSIIFPVEPETEYYLHIVNGYNRRSMAGNNSGEFTTWETYTQIPTQADGNSGIIFTTPADVSYVFLFFESAPTYTYDPENFILYKGNAIPENTNAYVKKVNLPTDTVFTGSDVISNLEETAQSLYSIGDFMPNWYFNDAHTRITCRLERIISGGVFRLAEYSTDLKCVLHAYDTPSLTNKVFDSGWLTGGTPYEHEINPNYYYIFFVQKTNNTAFDSLSDVDSVVLKHIIQTVKSELIKSPLISKTVRSIAHRGEVISAPQNTAPAYIFARKRGNTIAENDVNVSSDGAYVMWHDVNFAVCGNMVDINGYEMYTDGTTFYYYNSESGVLYTYNNGYVVSSVDVSTLTRCNGPNYTPESLPLSVLKRIDVGVYKDRKFQGTQILTFAEWIILMKQLGMDGYIDRKMGYTTQTITELANIVKSYGMLDHMSWIGIPTTDIIEALRAVDPNARIGILEHPNSTTIQTYAPYNTGRGFFFDGYAGNGLTRETVQIGLMAGFEVECYLVGYDYPVLTEDDVFNMILNALSYGVTGMTLDYYRVDEACQSMFNTYDF